MDALSRLREEQVQLEEMRDILEEYSGDDDSFEDLRELRRVYTRLRTLKAEIRELEGQLSKQIGV